MAIELVNLDTFPPETFGPFDTPQEADLSAEKSGFQAYALWENGRRLKLVGSPKPPLQDTE